MENKQAILNDLCKALQKTRRYEHLQSLTYLTDGDEETVHAGFRYGGKGKNGRLIDVTMDSGIAMIKDVLANI